MGSYGRNVVHICWGIDGVHHQKKKTTKKKNLVVTDIFWSKFTKIPIFLLNTVYIYIFSQ